MTQLTFFVKECPTCGRKLQVRIEYLGREMMCNHCGGDFIADEAFHSRPELESTNAIIARVDELLSDEPSQPEQRF